MRTQYVETSHGLVHMTIVGHVCSSKPTLLLIHGNSSSSKIFQHIISSTTINNELCVITCDLPGHGSSGDATNPEATYSMLGYASCLIEVLTNLSIRDVIILGWSLGGHIALEMIGLQNPAEHIIRIRGVMLTGTPPSSGTQVSAAFLGIEQSPHMHLTGQQHLSREEAYQYAHDAIGEPFEEWHRLDALRTDGRARQLMFESFRAGSGVDQAEIIAERRDVIFGVVNGAKEPFVNLDYIDNLNWLNLWEHCCYRLPDRGHAPFWEAPEEFEPFLVRFIQTCLSAHS